MARTALRVEAVVATTQEQFTQVQELAISLMYGARETDWLQVAHALIALPAEALQTDVPVFAAHPSKGPVDPSPRACGCAHLAGWWPGLGVKPAKDPESAVRYALAGSLNDRLQSGTVRAMSLSVVGAWSRCRTSSCSGLSANLQHRGITQRQFGAGEGDLPGDQLGGGW